MGVALLTKTWSKIKIAATHILCTANGLANDLAESAVDLVESMGCLGSNDIPRNWPIGLGLVAMGIAIPRNWPIRLGLVAVDIAIGVGLNKLGQGIEKGMEKHALIAAKNLRM